MNNARQRLESRRASLTPEQRALLEQKKRGLSVANARDASNAKDTQDTADGPPVLSSAQERSWFLHRLHPGDTSYNLCQALRLRGPLDVALLDRAFTELVERHDILRTRFREDGARVTPERLETLPKLEVLEWGVRSRSDEALAAFARERTAVPFRIEEEAPVRATLLVLGQHDQQEHALILVFHHVAVDGWSMGLIAKQWVELYVELSRSGKAIRRRGLQYVDFARWERDAQTRDRRGRSLAFWCDKLRGAVEADLVPTDHPRPKVPSGGAGVHTFIVGSELAEGLRGLAREEGTGPFAVLLSALSVLLARYSSQTDVSVGTPVAARTRPELESVVGLFANTVVHRSDLRGDPTFRALVRKVRADVLASLEHQGAPFEQVVAELAPRRDPSRTPLFQVFFAFEEAAPVSGPSELDIRVLDVGTKSSAFDLAVFVRERGPELAVTLEYRTDLYREPSIAAFGEHWLAVLSSAVSSPDRPLSRTRWCTEAQHAELVRTSDGGLRPYDDVCMHTLVEREAKRAPQAVAIVSEQEGTLTYGELDARATELAARLRALNVRRETPVAIFLQRSLVMPVAILAVLKAGGVCMPLEIDYPAERLEWMLRDACPAVVLTDTKLSGMLPDAVAQRQLRVLAVDAPAAETPAAMESRDDARPENSAYLIYTSGTTGRPKGVLVPHRGIVNHLFWMRDSFAMGAESRGMQKAPFGFGASLFELFAPLSFGGSVVMVRQDAGQDAAHLLELVRDRGVTMLEAVPSLLDTLLKTPAISECRSLRHVLAAGEALTTELVRRFGASAPSAILHNLYGPTEASFTISGWTCAEASGRAISIGRPIANVRLYVLNADLELVPRGAVGEIFAGGRAVTHGYHGAPAPTAEKFLPDPFGPPGSRLYRTGDLGRWLPDGTVECLGRIDHQVKIRGFRIELGEIETALTAHDGVREAVVVALGDEASRRLVAYYLPVAESLGSRGSRELRSHLRARLPDYMIPAVFVQLEAFPLSPNGKVDRAKLPAPVFSGAQDRVAPRSDRERAMADIWCSVLGVGEVGVLDDFFELGGNSMRLAEIVARVRARFGVELPLRHLFDDPTIAATVTCLDEAGARKLPPLVPRTRGQGQPERLPVSYAQEEVLRRAPVEGTRLSARLVGPLSVDVLHAALTDVVHRHEVLRTTYGRTGDAFWQEVHPEPLGPVLGDASVSFDLATDAPFRASVEPIEHDVHAFTLVVHPVAFDAMATQVLVRDLLAAYEARQTGSAPLPPLRIQPADHAIWQRAWVASPAGEALAREWRAELSPSRNVRAESAAEGGETVERTLGAAASARLRDFAQKQRFTLGMVVLASFALTAAERTGNDDVSVLVPTSGRDLVELEETVARLVNPVVVRIRLGGARGLLAACERVRKCLLWAEARAELPFAAIGHELPPYAFDPSSHVADAFHSGERAGLRIEALPQSNETPESDLELHVVPSSAPSGAELGLRARFRPHVHHVAEVSAWLETMLGILET